MEVTYCALLLVDGHVIDANCFDFEGDIGFACIGALCTTTDMGF